MAGDAYLALSSGQPTEVRASQASVGAGSAGDIIAANGSGKLDASWLDAGPETSTRTASEALSAGNLVNLWNDGGTAKMRKADASNGRRAQGYVSGTVDMGASGTVYFDGIIGGFVGLIPGNYYFLDDAVAGGIAAGPPVTAGRIVQEVGYSVSTTELFFHPMQAYTRA